MGAETGSGTLPCGCQVNGTGFTCPAHTPMNVTTDPGAGPDAGPDPAAQLPRPGDPDYNTYAVLFNDITNAKLDREHGGWFMFSDRRRLAEHLWVQGWRRELTPEDYTQ